MILVVLVPLAAMTPARADTLAAVQQLMSQGQFQQALAALEPIIQAEPENPEARFLRGVALAQTGDVDRAIAVFTSLTESYSELSEPYNNLAVLHASRGDYELARTALKRAVELQPDYHTAHENLGDVYAKLAAMSYQRAYHLRGSNDRARRKFDTLSALLAGDQPEVVPAESGRNAAVAPPPEPPRPPQEGDGVKDACLRVGPIAAEQRAVVAAWFRAQGQTPRPLDLEEQAHAHYQVFLPGAGSREATAALMDRLRSQGVTDVGYIGSGDLAGAISLGIFRQQDSVERRRAQLRDIGFEPQVVQRFRAQPRTWFIIPGDGAMEAAAIHTRFPALTVERDACR